MIKLFIEGYFGKEETMRLIPIKIFFYWLFTRISLKYPSLVKQHGKKYEIKKWDGGTFYYIKYWWKGGFFNNALDLIRGLTELSKKEERMNRCWEDFSMMKIGSWV